MTFSELTDLVEYEGEVGNKGQVTIPEGLRKRYALTPRKRVKLLAKDEGILIMPKADDPVTDLKGLARRVWPDSESSVSIVREIRRRAGFETKKDL